MRKLAPVILIVPLLLTACSEGPAPMQAADELAVTPPTQSTSPDDIPTGDARPIAGEAKAIETYFKAIVFIEGTAQLLGKFNIEELSNNTAAFAPLMMIPGVMDDRVIWAQKEALPDSLAGAWGKALEAEQGLIAALENLLMMQLSQKEFLQVVADHTALAWEAAVEAHAALAAQGASPEEIETLKRTTLAEMGETYQTFASLLAAGGSQGDGGSE